MDADMDHAIVSVRTYIDGIDGRVYFNARWFNLIQYCDDEHFIFVFQLHRERLSAVADWFERLQHRVERA